MSASTQQRALPLTTALPPPLQLPAVATAQAVIPHAQPTKGVDKYTTQTVNMSVLPFPLPHQQQAFLLQQQR